MLLGADCPLSHSQSAQHTNSVVRTPCQQTAAVQHTQARGQPKVVNVIKIASWLQGLDDGTNEVIAAQC